MTDQAQIDQTFRSFAVLRQLVRASGAEAWDAEGNRYLDCHGGIAVNSLGNCNSEVTAAVMEQSGQIIHTAATFSTPVQAEASARLAETFAPNSKVIWVNSGAEANENMVMAMRGFHYHADHPERTTVIAFEGCFHGRTMAMRALQGKFTDGIAIDPAVLGFKKAKFNDIDSVRVLVDEKTAGIIVEPIQGEGGIISAKPEFLEGLRRLCDEKGIMLAFDEVQCGVGRTGKMWAHQHYGVTPDLMSSAKGLGGGYPVAAVLLTEKVATQLKQKPANNKPAFSVGSTFGGNSAMLAAANKVIELVQTKYLGQDAEERSTLLKQELMKLWDQHKSTRIIKEVRGLGFFFGIELGDGISATKLRAELADKGLLTMNAGEKALRLLPPVTISKEHILEATQILAARLKEIEAERSAAAAPTEGKPGEVQQVNPPEQKKA